MSSRDVDCERARKALDTIRRNRRSQTATTLASAAGLLGYSIDRKRAKGSHWWATQSNQPRFPIPTTRDPVSVGVTTRILGILEKVLDDVCN
jgi:hypothetical protein